MRRVEHEGFVELEAAEGCMLRRVGECGRGVTVKGVTVAPDMANEWEEVSLDEALPYSEMEYRQEVVGRIRGRYSPDEESAILRKAVALVVCPATMASNEEEDARNEEILREFTEYNAFAEACKAGAREDLPGIVAERELREAERYEAWLAEREATEAGAEALRPEQKTEDGKGELEAEEEEPGDDVLARGTEL